MNTLLTKCSLATTDSMTFCNFSAPRIPTPPPIPTRIHTGTYIISNVAGLEELQDSPAQLSSSRSFQDFGSDWKWFLSCVYTRDGPSWVWVFRISYGAPPAESLLCIFADRMWWRVKDFRRGRELLELGRKEEMSGLVVVVMRRGFGRRQLKRVSETTDQCLKEWFCTNKNICILVLQNNTVYHNSGIRKIET